MLKPMLVKLVRKEEEQEEEEEEEEEEDWGAKSPVLLGPRTRLLLLF